jgi:rhodanese-related sulfurtransferase
MSHRYVDVEPKRVAQMIGNVHVVDVREQDELQGELGHILGVELVPLATIATVAASWEKERDIVLVCRSGGRSGRAAAALASMGFRRVMNMAGGMLAWNAAGLPVAR